MADFCPDSTMDKDLEEVAKSTQLHLCSSQPANHAAIAALSFGSKTVAAGAGNGAWVIEDRSGNGRQLRLIEQTGVAISGDGNSNWVAATDGATLHYVKELDEPEVHEDGDTSSIPGGIWIQKPDPVTS